MPAHFKPALFAPGLTVRMLFYSRNRLENNSEHWGALLISLRELADWASKKEEELEAIGPVGGDEATIKRQQVNKYSLFLSF